ncbi:proline dehydrogenase family protein [Pseudoduganella violaceinigra]|uniref:proline dehydrogenase family protein n=1 Tax=Pseudoduganella violaceinigra TaxID=246602 RepID=UPI001E40F472|nr:proline dehydrogenase family protein [Pseudoduganella violaceinigra]
MKDDATPHFPPQWQPLVDRAASALRELAINEEAKSRFLQDPMLRPFMERVSQRYVAGSNVADVVVRAAMINQNGHRASAEYMGESVRDEGFANAETSVFLQLIQAIGEQRLDCSISFDLSHVGSLIDPELGYRNARSIARAAREIGQEVMISMEASDRTSGIYDTYRRLHEQDGLSNVGITVPAKLHRTADDLPELMRIPGRIRLVKGAMFEAQDIAFPRNSPELASAYRRYAAQLLRSGRQCSIATHDRAIQDELAAMIRAENIAAGAYEFESLIGLGEQNIADLRDAGFATREYAVFGKEHFLYVLNRISEEPVRVYQAILDALGAA